jgi:hypothetical protein
MAGSKNNKKNKRILTAAVLIAVAAVLFIILIIVNNAAEQNRNSSTTTAPDTSPIMLAEDDPATITAVSYEYNGANLKFEFSSVAYKWYYKPDNNFPLEQIALQSMASVISSIAADRLVEDTRDNFASYGLDTPFMKITAQFKPEKEDAYTRTYNIGDLNTFNNTYYFNIEGTDQVYTIVSGLVDYFAFDLLSLSVTDTIPVFTDGQVYTMKGIIFDGTEIIDDNIITDDVVMANIVKNLTFISLSDKITYINPDDDENLAIYGLGSAAKTVTVNYDEAQNITNEDGSMSSSVLIDKTFVCGFGDVTTDGRTFFTVGSSGIVYLIDVSYDDLRA